MSKVTCLITERVYYAIHIKLCSPLLISSGSDDITDSDVLVDSAGRPFIPGTSLAGAFRNSLDLDKNEDCIMGYSNDEKGRMSQVIIHDVYLDNYNLSVRDGIRLKKDEKIVEDTGKFDMQIVETGATGWLYVEFTVRKGVKESEEYNQYIRSVINNIQNGDIRLGANKNRGFGRIEIDGIIEKHFSKENVNDWIVFLENPRITDETVIVSYDEWMKDEAVDIKSKYVKIIIPLELEGGISIRKYSTVPGEADYEHITCNDMPIVPGSSWNGAIRSRMLSILHKMNCPRAKDYMEEWFGYISKDKEKESNSKLKAQQSRVIISESVIKDSTRLPITRVKINRFDASAFSGGLYTELSNFGGTTNLEVMVEKKEGYKSILALLLFAIDDIRGGYLSVGGQTAVGRGIFKGADEIWFSEDVDVDECKKELYKSCIKE